MKYQEREHNKTYYPFCLEPQAKQTPSEPQGCTQCDTIKNYTRVGWGINDSAVTLGEAAPYACGAVESAGALPAQVGLRRIVGTPVVGASWGSEGATPREEVVVQVQGQETLR